MLEDFFLPKMSNMKLKKDCALFFQVNFSASKFF